MRVNLVSLSSWAYWLLCSFFVIVLSEVENPNSNSNNLMVNYVVTGDLPDGEQELKIKFGDVLLREESITESSSNRQNKLTLILRQVAKGPDFLQLIYKSNERAGVKKLRLVDCEVMSSSWKTTNEFRNNFQRQLEHAGVHVPFIQETPIAFDGENDGEGLMEDDLDILTPSEDNFDLDFDPEEKESMHKERIDLSPRFPELRNITVRMIQGDNDKLIQEYKSSAFDVEALKKQCNRFHRRLKKAILEQQKQEEQEQASQHHHKGQSRVRRETFPFGIVPGTYWCGFDKVASRRSSIGAHAGTDVCCRQHDHCPILIRAMTTQYGLFNYRMSTISHCSCDERLKRDLRISQFKDAFRMPGTKWCGMGYSALEVRDLGGYTGADKCCRAHDLNCPLYIEAFKEKYGLFNWRLYTVMHCACDERFRSCLKQTNTGSADFVGKLFFNVVQTKCFVLKTEKTCGRRSWWGKCEKEEYKKQAYLRDPIAY